MADIELYSKYPNRYEELQLLRPDYVSAIMESIRKAKKLSDVGEPSLLDLCCGSGINTALFSRKKSLRKAVLVDMNSNLLYIASQADIRTKSLETHHLDVLDYKPLQKLDIVFSIFAYHHLPNDQKQKYVDIIRESLTEDGILVLTEIYFDNKKEEIEYYENLLKAIPAERRSTELENFLKQTAKSRDLEFKVSKEYSDSQFKSSDFSLVSEEKIWPQDSTANGTFVQIYKPIIAR